MSYIFGFIAADGNICHGGRAYTLHVASDNVDVIEKVKKHLSYEGSIRRKPRMNGKISYSLRICDPIIFTDLQLLNVTERKSLTFCLPQIPRDLVRHFIRGFFDGDGSVVVLNIKYPSKLKAYFYTASREMAIFLHSQMEEILGNIYRSRIKYRETAQKTTYYSIELRCS